MKDYTSSNPAFGEKVWNRITPAFDVAPSTATIQGTVNKTLILIGLLFFTAIGSWTFASQSTSTEWFLPMVLVTTIAQLILTYLIISKPERSQTLGVVYALLEGVVLGALSFLFERLFPGIVIQAILGTSGVIAGMMILYKTQIIKVTENFKLMVVAATFGLAFLYLASMIANLFGSSIPFIHNNSTIGILFSLFAIGVAAFNLAIDFDFIEKCEEKKSPAYMEWYGAFGLLVTIVWIYIEMLRLLSKLRSKD